MVEALHAGGELTDSRNIIVAIGEVVFHTRKCHIGGMGIRKRGKNDSRDVYTIYAEEMEKNTGAESANLVLIGKAVCHLGHVGVW